MRMRAFWRLAGGAIDSTTRRLHDAAAYLRGHPDFDRFDRFTFLTHYATPAFTALGVLRQVIPDSALAYQPAQFSDERAISLEDQIGIVLASPSEMRSSIDADLGRGNIDHLPGHAHAFKTPTVRNVARPAPYMHNGAYTTLDDVLDFYNRGGGAGIGADVPNQTLDSLPLGLSVRERRDIIAFLGALVDTVVPIIPRR